MRITVKTLRKLIREVTRVSGSDLDAVRRSLAVTAMSFRERMTNDEVEVTYSFTDIGNGEFLIDKKNSPTGGVIFNWHTGNFSDERDDDDDSDDEDENDDYVPGERSR